MSTLHTHGDTAASVGTARKQGCTTIGGVGVHVHPRMAPPTLGLEHARLLAYNSCLCGALLEAEGLWSKASWGSGGIEKAYTWLILSQADRSARLVYRPCQLG